jgi:AcrR family transcriptional regulator
MNWGGQPIAGKYDSTARRDQARATRSRVLDSAMQLFTDNGYSGTPVAAIASRADVSDRMIYLAFGSKRGILYALLEHMAPVPRETFEADLTAAAADPHRQLRLAVGFIIDYYAGAAPFLSILRAAAAAEPDIQGFMDQGEAFRRAAQEPLIRHWSQRGSLAPGRTAAEAADILWMLTSPDVYLKLTSIPGWPPGRCRAWLIGTLDAQLLRSGALADGGIGLGAGVRAGPDRQQDM